MRICLMLVCIIFPALGFSAEPSIDIKISGVDQAQKERLLGNLSIQDLSAEKQITVDSIQSMHQLATIELKNTLETLGFYHAIIHSNLTANKEHFFAHYTITLGPAVHIDKINLKILGMGEQDSHLLSIQKKSPIQTGEILDHKVYEDFKQNWLEKALDIGYLKAHYEKNEILLDLDKNLASIVLFLNTDKRYKLGAVQFVNPPYPVSYLNRYIPFKSGAPYTTEEIVNFQSVLVNSGLFSKVIVEPKLDEAKEFSIPLSVQLKSKPHNKYTASLGFGTDTGYRGSLGWERRRVAYPGHRINIGTKMTQKSREAHAQYSIPGKNPATDQLVFGTQITEEKFNKRYSSRNETTISNFRVKGKIEEILALQYLEENFKDTPSSEKRHSHFLLPNIAYTWNSIGKAKILLKTGMRFSVSLKAGAKSLFSTHNLIQVENRIKWMLPLGELTRLILRTSVGATGTSSVDNIPLSLRFFAGGDYSVRGYGYQSLGPRKKDNNGNEIVVGGRYLLTTSLEIERQVYEKTGFAVFLDSGNAMNHWKSSLYNGAGFGFRYETPLGPIRLDIARPLLRGKHKPRIHFSFGVDL